MRREGYAVNMGNDLGGYDEGVRFDVDEIAEALAIIKFALEYDKPASVFPLKMEPEPNGDDED